MTEEEKVEKIAKVSKADGAKKLEPEIERIPPNGEQFDRFMGNIPQETANKVAPAGAVDAENAPKSLVQEVKDLNQQVGQINRGGSVDDLVAAADQVTNRIQTIKSELNSHTNIDMPSSTQRLLTNRLEHIDENLKIALNKAGVEYVAPVNAAEKATPIQRFLGMLTTGQNQLETISSQIQSLGPHLDPGSMLLIQVKVATVQQEIELFSSMLNKSLESIKTIMNVQV